MSGVKMSLRFNRDHNNRQDADPIRTTSIPMLLAEGDDDGDFLLGMIEMYNGLRFLGKEVTFVHYPGQASAPVGR